MEAAVEYSVAGLVVPGPRAVEGPVKATPWVREMVPAPVRQRRRETFVSGEVAPTDRPGIGWTGCAAGTQL